MKEKQPRQVKWPKATADVWLDLAAPSLDIGRVNRQLKLRATHWYTPEEVHPRTFKIARLTALEGEECCWQYRLGVSKRALPSAWINRLIRLIERRVTAIRAVCREHKIEPEVNVFIYDMKEVDPYVWMNARAVAVFARIKARVVVVTSGGNDRAPLTPPKKKRTI